MDRNEFFREATLRICGDISIESALHNTLLYLKEYIPIDAFFAEYFDPDTAEARTIARADESGGTALDLKTPLPPEAQQDREFKADAIPGKAVALNHPEENKMAAAMLEFHGYDINSTSIIVMQLVDEGDMFGGIIALSRKRDAFTEEHGNLLSMLADPFKIAMSNALKHRRQLELHERNFFWEFTRRICGTLELEKGLQDCLNYLSQYIPADGLYLEQYDKQSRSVVFMARAYPDKAQIMNMTIPLSEEEALGTERLGEAWGRNEIPQDFAFIANDPDKERITRTLLKASGEPLSSILSLPLFSGNQVTGALVVLAYGKDRYNETHARLLSTIREPVFLALTNSLRHRDEVKLYERNFFFEVTKRICGNLEIEQGLHQCFKYITQQLPGYKMYLERFNREFESMYIVAQADQEKGEKLDQMVPLDNEAMASIQKFAELRRTGKLPTVIIMNKPLEEPIIRCIMQARNEPESSVLLLNLVIGDQHLGTVALLAEGNNRFTEEHAALFEILREPFFVAMSNTLKHKEVLQLKDMLADDNRFLHQELHRLSGDNIIGAEFGLKAIMEKARQVASLDSPVLLQGETGVGKDVFANYIHYSSPRSNGPFVSINCGAIPESLIDSELFGHEKGAFTGALSQKRGRFERADQGTIFLDEIGELPPQAQVRLLRVLQEKTIERVGGTKPISLDIRIVAATNRNLEQMVQDGDFREDLWFRLNVFPIIIPPLRERTMDIPALLQYFIAQKSKEMKLPAIPPVAPGVIDRLLSYAWPGNVREVQNIVERALILNPRGPLTFDQINTSAAPVQTPAVMQADTVTSLDQAVTAHIQKALQKTEGKIHGQGGAAELLNINANTLRNRMKKLGIEFRKNRT